jgi:hypothetical protein
VSRHEQALVNVRLYLPQEWATDHARRRKCGVPAKVRFRTRHELALEMLNEQGSLLPHGWIAGDDEMGRCTWFRRELTTRGERYLLAVPSNTTVRDLAAPAPAGKRARPFEQVRRWAAALRAAAWTRIDVRDAHHGPWVAELAMTRVVAKTDRKWLGPEEVLVAMRDRTVWNAEVRRLSVKRRTGYAAPALENRRSLFGIASVAWSVRRSRDNIVETARTCWRPYT